MTNLSKPIVRFPSARQPNAVDLRLVVNNKEIFGNTAADFLNAVVDFIVAQGAFDRVEVPCKTI